MIKKEDDYQPLTYISTEYDPGVTTNYSAMISTERSLIKFILLSFATVGFYPIYFFYKCGRDLDIIAMKDGKRQYNFIVVLIFSLFLIFPMFVWGYRLTNRIGNELARRESNQKFGLYNYIIFILIIPALMVLTCVFFFFNRETFQTVNLLYVIIPAALVLVISYWIYIGKLISAMNELSRCMKYKNIQI